MSHFFIVKEIANKESNRIFSYSTESSRSLKHYCSNITKDNNNYEENFSDLDINNYDDNIEVQKLRNLLKTQNEKNTIKKSNQSMRNYTIDASGRIINFTISVESGGKLFKPPVSSKL